MNITEDLKWIVRTTKGIRLRLLAVVFLGVLSVSASIAFVWLTKKMIDIATKPNFKEDITLYISLLAGVIILQQILYILKARLNTRTSTSLMNRLRVELFDTVMRSEWNGKEKFHTGDLVSRIESDTRTISDTICITLPSILIICIQFIASFKFLHMLDSKLAWLVVVIMPIALILSKRFILKMRELTSSIRGTDSVILSHIQEQIQHRTIINSLGNTDMSTQELSSKSETLLGQTMRSINYTLYTRTMVQLGFGVGYLTVFLWGVNGLNSGLITFGTMTAFLQLVAQVQRPAIELSSQLSASAKSVASVERIHSLELMSVEQSGEKEILEPAVGVRARELSFRYSDGGERYILNNFSYDFTPNSMHVIVGHTGVGKSTLIRLMLGLLKSNAGSLELYNSERSASCSPTTRSNFVYVPQGNTLMSGTVRDNLLLSKPSASDEELREALHSAVADFVYDMPDGIDSMCGERGAGLSEGEAQRIAIARGLLQSGNVMLLDEPTSALDSATEELLIKRLSKYAENRTLIMVTHRDTASMLCASVVRLDVP